MSNNTGFSIKEGRSNKQYINTNFDFIDAINEYADCETLGFYISFKRYINRKDNTKDNQVTYSQSYLEKQLNVGRTKYYRHLKILFNAGLCDVEKIVEVKFFINYNLDNNNPLVQKSIIYFSTLDNIDISLKGNLENLINEYYPEIPSELIKIVDVVNKTSYIFHDYPPVDILEENGYKFVDYRDWDIIMNRFSSGKNIQNDNTIPPSQNEKVGDSQDKIDPSSQNRKEGASQNRKTPPSQNRKVNNIIELNNSIIESSNSIINQSIEADEKEDKSNKEENNGLIDLDKQIKEKGFISFDDLVYNLRLEKHFFDYPLCEWIDPFKKAIWEMYYYDDTKIRGKKISRFDAIIKLQKINIDMVTTTISKVIESSEEQEIKYPVAFIKTAIFNEIDEYYARIQAQINYALADKESVEEIAINKKTRFHNFRQRSDNYTAEELEDIAWEKREEYRNGKNIVKEF